MSLDFYTSSFVSGVGSSGLRVFFEQCVFSLNYTSKLRVVVFIVFLFFENACCHCQIIFSPQLVNQSYRAVGKFISSVSLTSCICPYPAAVLIDLVRHSLISEKISLFFFSFFFLRCFVIAPHCPSHAFGKKAEIYVAVILHMQEDVIQECFRTHDPEQW